jgi:hypothetical protein
MKNEVSMILQCVPYMLHNFTVCPLHATQLFFFISCLGNGQRIDQHPFHFCMKTAQLHCSQLPYCNGEQQRLAV